VDQEGETHEGEITVRVGASGAYVQQRFHGRMLGKQSSVSADQVTVTNHRLYLTRKGAYAVHRKDAPNWTRRNWGNTKDLAQWLYGDGQGGQPLSRLDVYATLAELRDHIPPELFAVATQQNNGEPLIEDLDI
jgi:EXLDI family protein